MPKLLQIDSCLGIGSTGKIAENIAEISRNRGWETYIVHGTRYVGKTKQIGIPAITKLGEYKNILSSLVFDNHGLSGEKYTKRIINTIISINPDIIHLHCIHGYYLNYRLLFEFLNNYKKPIVWTQHDCWGFTGHCAYFEKNQCKKWINGCYQCELKNTYPKSILYDRSNYNWNLKKELITPIENLIIVSVSKWLDSLVSKSFLSEKKHIVIYNGVDTNIFSFRESNLREKYNIGNKFLLLAVATSWSNSKGLLDYIEISKKLSSNEKLVLIGLKDKQIKSIPENILCLPRTNNSIELAEWYTTADVVLNLSYQETFGLTTVEGMACGTPSIVYNCTASPELVTPQTGFIVNKGDIKSVFDVISAIKNNSKQKYLMECRNHVLSNFDMTEQFHKYVDLYDSLIK